MNRDDIIRMARKAHHELVTKDYPGHAGQLDPWTMQLLERFAAFVAAAEQEACAKECDWVLARLSEMAEDIGADAAFSCLEMIRKRGEK